MAVRTNIIANVKTVEISNGRYVVCDLDNYVLDTANGYGFSSAKNARNGYKHKHNDKSISETEGKKITVTELEQDIEENFHQMSLADLGIDIPQNITEKKTNKRMQSIFKRTSKRETKNKNEKNLIITERMEKDNDIYNVLQETKEEDIVLNIYGNNDYKTNTILKKEIELTKLLSNDMTEIPDMSPIFLDFISQDKKHIYICDENTGAGKSYSFNRFLDHLIETGKINEFDKIYYVTDRINNIEDEYKEFVKRHPIEKSVAVHLRGKADSFRMREDGNMPDTLSAFLNLPDVFKKGQYKDLNSLVSNNDFWNMTSINPDRIAEKQIDEFKKEVVNNIKKELTQKGVSPDKMYEYVKSHPTLCKILDVFPGSKMKDTKIVFATGDKMYYPIDTIFEKNIYPLRDSEKCIYFFDEGDTLKNVLEKRITEESVKTEHDILSLLDIGIKRLNEKEIPSDILENKIEIKEEIDNLAKRINEFHLKYHLNKFVKFKMDYPNRFLFLPKENDTVFLDGEDCAIVDENEYCVLYEIKDNIKVDNETLLVSNMAREALILFNNLIRIIRKYADLISTENDDHSTYEKQEQIKKVITSMYSDIIKDTAIKSLTSIINNFVPLKNKIQNGETIYDSTRIFADIKQKEGNNLNLWLSVCVINTTPEKMLMTLVKNGGKAIIASATGRNESPGRNFNYNWEPLQNELYELSEHQKKLLSEYTKNRDLYGNRVKYNILQTPQTIDDIKKNIAKQLNEITSIEYDTCMEKIDEIENRCKSNKEPDNAKNNSNNHTIEETWKLAYAMLEFYIKKVRFGLCFISWDNNKNKYNTIIEEIKEFIRDKNEHYFIYENTNSKKLKDSIVTLHDKISKNSTVMLVCPYETAQKGCNFQYVCHDRKNLVAINAKGEEKLKGSEDVFIDADGLYLGEVTNVLSQMMTNSLEPTDKNTLIIQNLNLIDEMKVNADIDKDEYKKLMNATIKMSSTYIEQADAMPITKHCKHHSKRTYTTKLGAILQQSIGRILRCEVRRDNAFVIVNNNIIDNFKTTSIDDVFKFSKDKFQHGMNEIFNYTFYESEYENRLNNAMRCEEITKKSAKAINELITHMQSRAGYYRTVRKNIKALFISEEKYQSLPKGIQWHYMPITEEFYDGYYYVPIVLENDVEYTKKIECTKQDNCKCISKEKLGIDTLHPNIIAHIQLSGFKWDVPQSDKVYVLTPAAFSILHGNIGEIIAEYLAMLCGFTLEELPNKINEKMDYIYTRCFNSKNKISCFDIKYYNSKTNTEKYDSPDTKIKEFTEKLNCIKKYYDDLNNTDVEIVGFVINTRNNVSNNYKPQIREEIAHNIKLITIPNIYKRDATIDEEIAKYIVQEVY